MKKIALQIAALLLISSAAQAQTQVWKLDKSHSSVNFAVDHMVISETKGQFKTITADVKADKPDFTDATVNFTLDVKSINTEDDGRDGHLKGEDFFNAAKYPTITFISKSFKKVKGNMYKLTGDLTMHGVTKTVTLDAKYNGIIKSPFGDTRTGVSVYGEIDRYAFGLKYNSLLEAGGAAIGQKVRIACSLELIKG
jgi:polyisoprenoid-binding protein YceI